MNASDHAKAAMLYLERLCAQLDRGERLVRERKDWWIGLAGLPLALGLCAATISCKSQTNRGPSDPLQLQDRCSRSRSGAPNCHDPACNSFCHGIEYGAPLMAKETDCHDNNDNDGDSFVDCEDPDCAPQCSVPAYAAPPAPRSSHEYNCNDGVDDDNDGLLDCLDPDCSSLSACANSPNSRQIQRAKERDCTNGIDDDNDGATDCSDSDCYANTACRGAEYAAPSPPVALYAAPHM
jgi:hypothetical protein